MHQEIGGARYDSWRLSHSLECFEGQDMEFATVGAGVHYPFLTHIQSSAVRLVYFFVRILLEHLAQQWGKVSVIAFGRVKTTAGIVFGVFLESLVPIGFHRRHFAARRNVESDTAADRKSVV